MHHLGLKFGIYVTPGISKQAVAENTPIEGTISVPLVAGSNTIEFANPGAYAPDFGLPPRPSGTLRGHSITIRAPGPARRAAAGPYPQRAGRGFFCC